MTEAPRATSTTLPPHFEYRDDALFVEDLPLAAVADRHGTPTYVYSKAALVEAFAAYHDPCRARTGRGDALVCYAVKANANLSVLRVFAEAGAGFDIVSGGELERVLAAGGDPARVIFSGVGKTQDEMRRALEVGIDCFNVESSSELRQLAAVARTLGKVAPVSLRVNPDVDARTHPYIATGLKESKFGIAYDEALALYADAASMPELAVIGVDCHIGSQLLDAGPLIDALEKLIVLVDALADRGIAITQLDLGGGIGIDYGDDPDAPGIDVARYLGRVFERIDRWRDQRHAGRPIRLLFEPGRSLVGNAGALLTTTLVLKPGTGRNFAVVDAAMNDLIRPTLYDAWHRIVPLTPRTGDAPTWDVVGPICESGDWLARDRPLAIAEGDRLAILSAGAYAMTMASNYNSRPRAAEVLVDGGSMVVVRSRETIDRILSDERVPQ